MACCARWILAIGLGSLPSVAAAQGEAGTIYVQLDGPTLSLGPADDARSDTTAIAELAMALEPFGGDVSARAAVLAAVQADFAPFDVRVVDQRPASGDYVMAVVTPTNPFGDGVAGAALTDCDDAAGRRDVVFAFFAADAAPVDVASTIAQEVGHSFGLEHVDDPEDLLYPLATGGDPAFVDACLPLVGEPLCGAQHEDYCDGPDQQSSFAELLAAFGSAVADDEPPDVTVSLPAGDVVSAGDDVEIEVEATDDLRVDTVVLYEGGEAVGEDRTAPYAFVVAAIEEGSYEIHAVAIDAAGNERESEVVELVAEPGGIPAAGAAPLGPVARGGDDGGCNVAARPLQANAAWIVPILVLGAGTRRRGTTR